MAHDIAELNIEDFRYIFVKTPIGEIGIGKTDEGVRISIDGENFVIKIHGENSFTIKVEK